MDNYQTEKPIHNRYNNTQRSLDPNSIQNQHLNKSVSETIAKLLNEVKIRFDTDPKCYQKNDFRKLIDLIRLMSVSEENVQADWNETDETSDAFIKNKPDIPKEITDIYEDRVSALETGKQDKLIPGAGIKIENNVISSTAVELEPYSEQEILSIFFGEQFDIDSLYVNGEYIDGQLNLLEPQIITFIYE